MKQTIERLTAEGRYEEALGFLDKVIEAEPDNEEAYYLRGFLYKQLGKWAESLNDLSKALEINPESRAGILRKMLQDIISFRHTDLYNP